MSSSRYRHFEFEDQRYRALMLFEQVRSFWRWDKYSWVKVPDPEARKEWYALVEQPVAGAELSSAAAGAALSSASVGLTSTPPRAPQKGRSQSVARSP